jgi:hypothetical protein
MLSDELARLTRHFHQRPGAEPAAIAAAVAAAQARAAVRPGAEVPADYLDYLAQANGAFGAPGDGGLWVRLEAIEDALPMTLAHGLPPGLLLIGGTRLGEGLALDTRAAGRPAEFVTLDLSWFGELDTRDALGPSLEAALQTLEQMGPGRVPRSVAAQQALEIGYVPTPQPVVTAMLRVARLQPGEMVYDLGGGDGRIVITAARDFAARGVGFELNMELIQAARALAVAANVRHAAAFRRQDLFTVDLAPADVVTLFLRPEMNARLVPRLKQLRPGARVVTYEFRLADYEPARAEWVAYAPGRRGQVRVWEAPL